VAASEVQKTSFEECSMKLPMKGTVVHIHHQRGMIAVQTEDGDYSVLELLGADDLEIGDEVEWPDDTALGGEPLTNHTRSSTFEVYFQNHHVSAAQLRQQLLYP
jgi:hypothetical protein